MKFLDTPINGLYIIERNIVSDDRGYFFRIFAKEELLKIGHTKPIVHINFSHANNRYTTKGLHFQYPPYSEIKIVTCVKGEVFDFVVDLRKNSPHFLKWFGITLSEKNKKSIYIPEGFAHGFQSISEDSELIYLHTESYRKESEGGINIFDPKIGIQLPSPPVNLSDRDKNFSFLNNDFEGVTIV
ncbi:MAG: dTDP-4-dehydrorhamnose 3,5-epimerase [Leptospiraceae bacterium]|nr:dTDP-4-dehydrorhamnose 3,5-epimerase [Leptospiraceae bacterium]NUM42276.1 dTDP-4-dehydrorhamnose 3,5-epimerase [Leptospiraceae bacterium]